jgi:hypothetical protein
VVAPRCSALPLVDRYDCEIAYVGFDLAQSADDVASGSVMLFPVENICT